MTWIDLVGYSASICIVASFLIKNNLKLTRIVNLVGCVFFTIYGFSIDSIPIIIPNAFLVFVQLYYLFLNPEKN